MKTVTINKTYKAVKEILEAARSAAYRAVNFAMVQAYWNIGRVIVEEEQRGKATAGYGEYLIKELAERLTKEFGKGFTISNIKYFRQFYFRSQLATQCVANLRVPERFITHCVMNLYLLKKVTQCVTHLSHLKKAAHCVTNYP